MVLLLASVADLAEAELADVGGADILDLKDPAAGALGNWPTERVRHAVWRFGGRRPLSATIGDVVLLPSVVERRVREMADTGVDIVKVGIFAGELDGTLRLLSRLAQRGTRLVAVMFADRQPPLCRLNDFAVAGFYGVMLDTADKRAGGLRHYLALSTLAAFIEQGRALGLGVGLAGSLGLADIAPLAALKPDWLGFRGALCAGARHGRLDPDRLAAVRAALTACGQPQSGHSVGWSDHRGGAAGLAVQT